MDWNLAIEKNREALKRILATLVAMAGLTIGQSPPLRGRCPAGQRGVGSEGAVGLARHTLPRHLHRAVLRLLRPAEAAVRRLVIVAARDIIVALPPPRPREPKPDPKAAHTVLRRLGIAVVMPHNVPHPKARGNPELRACRGVEGGLRRAPAREKIALPLFDAIRTPKPCRPRYVPAHAAPRILSFDGPRPHRLPPPPSPNDPVDATRLNLRLQALASALDDLPKHAKRFARWKAARDAAGAQNKGNHARGLVRRVSPLRPGRPPGLSAANRRRPAHDVHEVLADLQYFAFKALEAPDTS